MRGSVFIVSTNLIRRQLIKSVGLVMVFVPVAALTGEAVAATNPELRAKLKYQGMPSDGKRCISCLEFLPGKTEQDLGRCKVIPGDDEISPEAYCSLWNTM